MQNIIHWGGQGGVGHPAALSHALLPISHRPPPPPPALSPIGTVPLDPSLFSPAPVSSAPSACSLPPLSSPLRRFTTHTD